MALSPGDADQLTQWIVAQSERERQQREQFGPPSPPQSHPSAMGPMALPAAPSTPLPVPAAPPPGQAPTAQPQAGPRRPAPSDTVSLSEPQEAQLGPAGEEAQSNADMTAAIRAATFDPDPKANKLMQDAVIERTRGERFAAENKTDLERARLETEAAMAHKRAENIATEKAAYEAHHAEGMRQFQGMWSDVLGGMREMQAKRIDPDAGWTDRSLPSKASGMLGLLVAGLGGTDSVRGVMNTLESQMDRSLKAQQMETEIGMSTLGMQMNLLGHFERQLGSPEAAMAVTKAYALDHYAEQMKEAAALNGIDTNGPAYQATLTELNNRTRDLLAQAQSVAAQRHAASMNQQWLATHPPIDTLLKREHTAAETGKLVAEAEKTRTEAAAGPKKSEGEKEKSALADELERFDSLDKATRKSVAARAKKELGVEPDSGKEAASLAGSLRRSMGSGGASKIEPVQ